MLDDKAKMLRFNKTCDENTVPTIELPMDISVKDNFNVGLRPQMRHSVPEGVWPRYFKPWGLFPGTISTPSFV